MKNDLLCKSQSNQDLSFAHPITFTSTAEVWGDGICACTFSCCVLRCLSPVPLFSRLVFEDKLHRDPVGPEGKPIASKPHEHV